jgi:hypothetical protein
MRYTNSLHMSVVVMALGLSGCGDGSPASPVGPSPVPPQAAVPSPSPGDFLTGHALTGVSLSGVVYELTPTGRAPIARAIVYCEPCGAGTHTFATADDNGVYHFPGDVSAGGGVWIAAGVPTPLAVGYYNKDYEDPPGMPLTPRGPGWRQVLIDADTTFDIELVRRAVAAP